MGIKNLFRKDDLEEEFKLLPDVTKKRILENVNKRRSEIIEEKILERQLKEISQPKEKKRTFGKIKEGMQKRRKELIEQGIIQPPIKYNKENYRSPLEEMSRKARKDEIQRLEDQRNKLKSGCQLGDDMKIKIKDLKLRMPEDKFKRKKSGFI